MCIMLPLFLHAGVLCVLLWLVTRGTADIEFWRVFFIAFGISILGRVTGLLVGDVFLRASCWYQFWVCLLSY